MFFKIVVLNNFAIFTWEQSCWSLLIKLQALQGDSNIGAAMGILQKFYEHLFYRTFPLAASTVLKNS